MGAFFSHAVFHRCVDGCAVCHPEGADGADVSGSREATAIDFSLLPADDEEEPAGETVQPDEVLMRLGEGISGGVRYGPDSQSGD